MKNVKVIGYGLLVLGMLLVGMPTQAQGFKNQKSEDRVQTQNFQSTSTMTPVGSAYSANPMLNEDGTAYNPAQAASPAKAGGGPRKIGPGVSETIDEKDKVPVGDAVLPLTLCAMLFAGVIALRRRRSVLNR